MAKRKEDEVFDSAEFAFEWRKLDFKMFYVYLFLLALCGVFLQMLNLTFPAGQAFAASLQSGFQILALIVLFSIALSFLSSVVQALLLQFAFKSSKVKVRRLSLRDFVLFFLMNIVSAVAALMSVYNPRGLAFLGAIILFGIIAYATSISGLGVLVLLAAVAYAVVFIYNYLRLSQAHFFFVTGEKGFFASLKKSLDATLGNVLWLVFVYIVVFLMVGIVVGIIIFVPYALAALALGGFQMIFPKLIYALLTPIASFSFAFAGVSIFQFLLKRKKKTATWRF